MRRPLLPTSTGRLPPHARGMRRFGQLRAAPHATGRFPATQRGATIPCVWVEPATDPDPILTRRLSDAQVQLLRSAGGVTRTTSVGEVLFKEGDPTYEFIVILEGTV